MTLCVVCVCVRALKGKQLELSTPNSVHIYPTTVVRRALNRRSEGQSQDHTVTKTVTVAWLLVAAMAVVLLRGTARRMTA